MSNKSGIGDNVVSLPSGGGAISGMGEKFSPDLFTGTGNFSVPISIPEGRNGFQPSLTLGYSTGNGNGPFGQGWGLSVPSITRKTNRGVPKYNDEDVFILSGSEDLIPISEKEYEERVTEVVDVSEQLTITDAVHYKPRTEGLFARITFKKVKIDLVDWGTNNSIEDRGKFEFWEVKSKDGLTSYYGSPDLDVRDIDYSKNQCFIADPSDRNNIFAWNLHKTIDTFGNSILYTYQRDFVQSNQNENVEGFDQLYLSKVQYIDWDNFGIDRYLVSVSFLGMDEADPDRPDSYSSYNSGFQIRTRKRCHEILIRTHPVTADLPDHYNDIGYDFLVGIKTKSYLLKYTDQDGEIKNSLNNVSLLSSVQVKGWDKESDGVTDLVEFMPPLKFDYTKYSPEQRDFFPVKGKSLPNISLSTPTFELIDLDGNGLPDVIEMNGAYIRYWTNRGNGTFDLPRLMGDAPSGLSLEDQNVQLVDADGDGRADLLVNKPGISGYFPLNFDGKWDQGSFVKQELAPSFSFSDPEVKMLDINGDGITDVLRNGSRLECFFQDREEGWNETRFVNRSQADNFPNVSFADPSVKTADMNGDGLQDIVIVKNGSLVYWPSKGHGNWGHRIQMKSMPRLDYYFDPKRILLGDLDGDGLADMAYIENNKITIWINQQGESWSDPIEINGTPAVNDLDSVRLADILGQGTPGILWTSDGSYQARNSWFFLDLTGGTKPYVLQEMDNNMGAVTKVKYESSVVHYLRDFKNPNTRWQTTLPFPVQVVSCVEVIDKISKGKLATEYEYHHGYWDGGEREFRGFGRVDQFDTETFQRYNEEGLHGAEEFEAVSETSFSPPLHTKSWFYLGPIGSEYGDWKIPDFSKEFFVDPDLSGDELEAYLDRDIDSFKIQDNLNSYLSSMPRRARRDAHRALRGSSLRTELFALDGSALEARPYTVTESGFEVRKEFEPSEFESDANNFPVKKNWGSAYVFFALNTASRTTQWERGSLDENHHNFSFTRDFDQYGNAQKTISIAVPRNRDFSEELTSYTEDQYLATYSETIYGYNDTENSHYIVDRVCSKKDFEIDNDGTQSLEDIKDQTYIDSNKVAFAHVVYNYDGGSLGNINGSGFGVIQQWGALKRVRKLVISTDVITNVYGQTPLIYKNTNDSAWNNYPKEAQDIVNLTLYSAGGSEQFEGGYYNLVSRMKLNGKGLISRDWVGYKYYQRYDYNTYAYKPTLDLKADLSISGLSTGAANQTRITLDYRTLQPAILRDSNRNYSKTLFSPLGFVRSKLFADKSSYRDTENDPAVKLEYDFFNFKNNGDPVYVKSTTREYHKNDSISDRVFLKYEYSDGFGRLLQSRQEAEDLIYGATSDDRIFGDTGLNPDPDGSSVNAQGTERDSEDPLNVVVSGWQVYDNKGQVIEKYEPYFDSGFDYSDPTEAQKGVKVQMFYDPRGQVVKTLNPDGGIQKVLFGVPGTINVPDLTSYDNFEPTPWESYTYDANDLSGVTHSTESADYDEHWNTPSSVKLDTLGRQVETRQRLDANSSNDIVMQYSYDIRGNVLNITDALSRVLVTNKYAEANWLIKEDHIDKGETTFYYHYSNQPKHIVQDNGSETMLFFDGLARTIYKWAIDNSGDAWTVREFFYYGDYALSPTTRFIDNNVGRLYQVFDGAGLKEFTKYDFKGNPTETKRWVVKDSVLKNSIPTDWLDLDEYGFSADHSALIPNDYTTSGSVKPVDTELNAHKLAYLESKVYEEDFEYDALSRPTSTTLPHNEVTNTSSLTQSISYNQRGLVKEIKLGDGTNSSAKVHYNAKGQRILMLSNKIMTRYAYDDQTFRLKRIRAWAYNEPSTNEYSELDTSNWHKKLDYSYEYDQVGNILSLRDKSPNVNDVHGPGDLTRLYEYDPIYRLLSATGRECSTGLNSGTPWHEDNAYRCLDYTSTNNYKRTYSYDKLGNILQLEHDVTSGSGTDFTRNYIYPSGNASNKLESLENASSSTVADYTYDASGNQIGEGTSRIFTWNHQNQLKTFFIQGSNGSEPSFYSIYLYDSNGQRVKKFTRASSTLYRVSNYIGQSYEHLYNANGSLVVDDSNNNFDWYSMFLGSERVNSERYGNDTEAKAGASDFLEYINDHLGSVVLTYNSTSGALHSREECFPFGENAFGGYAKKRYRFTGKERDDGSGLYYFGARYYAPWLCRFTSVDPKWNTSPHECSYCYGGNNPILFNDPDGMQKNNTGNSKSSDSGGKNLSEKTNSNTGESKKINIDFGANDHAKGDFDFESGTYTIGGGGGEKGFDSLTSIAKRFGTTVDELKTVNNLDSDKIYAGNTLKIPGHSTEQVKSLIVDHLSEKISPNVDYPSLNEKNQMINDFLNENVIVDQESSAVFLNTEEPTAFDFNQIGEFLQDKAVDFLEDKATEMIMKKIGNKIKTKGLKTFGALLTGELLLKKLGKVAARTIALTVDFLLEPISAGQNESTVYNKIQKQFNIQAQPIRTY